MDPLFRLYDAGRVRRYHTIADYTGVPQQNLADHSWGVALFAEALAKHSGLEPSARLILAALTHDLAEYLVADVPAPVKWKYPRLRAALKEAEEAAGEALGIDNEVTTLESDILRWADVLEMYLYAVRVGAAYDHIADNLEKHILEGKMPRLSAGDHYFNLIRRTRHGR